MIVTKLEGALLDFWVAKSAGLEVVVGPGGDVCASGDDLAEAQPYHPSTDWTQGGAIVSNEWYDLETVLDKWFGPGWPYAKAFSNEPLKWMMRAYVAAQFGDEVEDEVVVQQPIGVALGSAARPTGTTGWRVLDFLRGLGRPSNARSHQLYQ